VPTWLCRTCGTQYPPSDAPPGACPICEDPRQYVPHDTGQQWVRYDAFLDDHKADIRDDAGILGIGCTPDFAIGQRALLVRSNAGNVLWDCTAYLDDAVRKRIGNEGGQVLHWSERRALLSGDIVQVIPDRRYVSFMYSFPNLIPLPPSKVQAIAAALEPYPFDAIYGAWWGRVIERDGSGVVRRSAERYVRAVTEPGLPS